MTENTSTPDEARRAAHHEAVKSQVDRDVNAKIGALTAQTTPDEATEMGKVAGSLRGKAIDEVAGQDREVRRARVLARVSQVFDYAFFVLYGLLGIRLVLSLIGARSGAGFVKFIVAVTAPFFSMFEGIVSSPSAGGFTLALPIIIALCFYGLLHLGVTGLFRLIAHRKTAL